MAIDEDFAFVMNKFKDILYILEVNLSNYKNIKYLYLIRDDLNALYYTITDNDFIIENIHKPYINNCIQPTELETNLAIYKAHPNRQRMIMG